jgi:dCMP deaminase
VSRPDWDSYFFEVASVVAKRATCPRAQIGACLVKNKRVIGTGYNGVPEGDPHCPNTPEHLALDHCQESVHAEYNAMANALVPAFGATLYVVGSRRVCPNCADVLHENGVTDIRWQQSAPTLDALARDIRAWQWQTFPLATPASVAEHLRREAEELAVAPSSAEEIADIFHLLVAAADANGYDLENLIATKFAINQQRAWSPPDEQGVSEHVRDEVFGAGGSARG